MTTTQKAKYNQVYLACQNGGISNDESHEIAMDYATRRDGGVVNMEIVIIEAIVSAKPQTKVAEYRGIPIHKTGMAKGGGSLEFPRILCAPTGGGGWWSVDSLEEAQAAIDSACTKGAKPADWVYTPQPALPPNGSDKRSITPEGLIRIAGKSLVRIIELSIAVNSPTTQVTKGWPLMSWVVDGMA